MKKVFLSIFLALVLVLGSVGCGSNSKTEESQSQQQEAASSSKEVYVPIVALGYGHQFWQAVKQGAEQAADEYGLKITFEGPEQETMVDKQVDMVKTALAKNPKVICVAAIDIEALRQDLEKAKSSGVKVVGFDAGVGDLADSTATTDSYAAGALAADNAARLLENKGKVGIVGHSQTVVDAVARVNGFKETIAEKYPDIEVVDEQYGDGDHLKSADVAKGMMQAHPDIQLIYTSNEGSCVGAYNGLKEANLIGKVKLIGFDSSAALKAAIKSGEIAGAITQNPVRMGYLTVETAYKLYKGEDVQTSIDTGCYWYDSSNMEDPDIAPLLYD